MGRQAFEDGEQKKTEEQGRPPRSALWIGLAVAAAVLFHVLATAIYLGPPNIAKLETQDLVNRYMHPVFRQNWHLFSPMPAISSTKLPIRCQSVDGSWTGWVDALEPLYSAHYRYRVTGHGKLLMMYRRLGADLNDALGEAQAQCDPDGAGTNEDTASEAPNCSRPGMVAAASETAAYDLASRFAVEVCRANGGDQVQAAQFKVMDFVPVKFSERETATTRWGSVTEVEFPAIPLDDPEIAGLLPGGAP